MIPILVIGFVAAKKFKRSPIVEEKPVEKIVERIIEKIVETPQKKYEDGYDLKLSVYLSVQTLAKLDEMHSSKIISESKYSKIVETQKFIQQNL